MTITTWNTLVNTDISIDGEWSTDDGYVKELTFESGKKREYLTNNFIPHVFSSLSLLLDDERIIAPGRNNTEMKQFVFWHETVLRYGVTPFYLPRLRFPAETGIYKFITRPTYEKTGNSWIAAFGLREIG